jgi:hypothetical protein
MSFYCHASKRVVSGETMVLVPTVIREVEYSGFFIKKGRGDEEPRKIYTGSSIGWEIVEEVPVCKSKEEEFLKDFKPRTVAKRKVEFYKPRKKTVEKTFEDEFRFNDAFEEKLEESKIEAF